MGYENSVSESCLGLWVMKILLCEIKGVLMVWVTKIVVYKVKSVLVVWVMKLVMYRVYTRRVSSERYGSVDNGNSVMCRVGLGDDQTLSSRYIV
ncbi:hypothetical protein AVEN_237417-1 [Araneus ventricosus]|uniref:Transmembrane protein n=1 Tax=Araneus ventricosus TaxID=182803 RepID=A0A4Y2KLA1_ARAVE|nr:hypothetical protein AVEN_237417-1 [Araneus ventricosus]